MAELVVEIECAQGVDATASCAAVTAAFRDRLGLTPRVTAVPRDTLPRFELKAKRFIVEG